MGDSRVRELQILGKGMVSRMMPACMLSHFSRVQFFAALWTIARQAPLSKGFSRQEYWSGLPCPPPGDLLDPEIKPMSVLPHCQVGSLPLAPPGKPFKDDKMAHFKCHL